MWLFMLPVSTFSILRMLPYDVLHIKDASAYAMHLQTYSEVC